MFKTDETVINVHKELLESPRLFSNRENEETFDRSVQQVPGIVKHSNQMSNYF